MNNALLFLGGLLIAALAALFAVPHFIDWNTYRGVFEEEASRVLGRELRVGGAVNVRFLPTPYLSFEKVRIADTAESGGGSLARVDSFTMWLSVPPLLRGVLEANRIELRRPVLQLASDAAGGGNWTTLSLNPGAMPFVPRDLALQSVNIIDGAIIMSGPQRGELARVEDINGELQAEALDGPYKFVGKVSWNGAPEAVRLTTGKPEADGKIRIKAAVDSHVTSNSYLLDGHLRALLSRPVLEGELTAKLNYGAAGSAPAALAAKAEKPAPAEARPAEASPTDAPKPEAKPDLAPPATPATAAPSSAAANKLELKAKVNATAAGAELSDIAVALETDGAPQLVTGTAKLAWHEKLRLDVGLSSKWLDLDKLASPDDSKAPLEAARGYFAALASLLPEEADTSATLDFEQLTLGGEPLGDVRLAALRAGGPLELKGVRATLPGGARLLLDGVLEPGGKVPKLDGELFITGQSLHRFLAWGFKQPDIGTGRTDGPFALDGHFTLSETSIGLSEATAEWSGTELHGEVSLDLSERRKLKLLVAGARVDASQIRAGLVSVKSLESLMTDLTADGASAGPLIPGLDIGNTDLSLRLKIGELTDNAKTLNNFDAEISIEKGGLSLPVLRFTTADGLTVEADGDAQDVPAKPHGMIRTVIGAPTEAAARSFIALLELPDAERKAAERLASLAPMRLAGLLSFAADGQGSELKVDGTAAGGRLMSTVRLASQDAWRSKPLDLSATMTDVDTAQLLSTVFAVKPLRGAPTPYGKGSLVFKAAGTPLNGMHSLADVKADGLSLEYRGTIGTTATSALFASGDLKVDARDGRSLALLAGLPTAPGAAEAAISGPIALSLKDGSLKLDTADLAVDGNKLRGTLTVNADDSGKTNVTADLAAETLKISSLLTPLLARPEAAPEPAPPPVPQRTKRRSAEPPPPPPLRPIWPEQTFDLSALDRISGTIKIRAGGLALEPGLTLADATLEAVLSDRGITIPRFEGTALGGKLLSKLDLERFPAGAGLKGMLRIDLATNPKTPAGEPGDIVAFGIDLAGRALSPAALVASLDGKGEVSVGDVAISGMSPSAIATVAEAAVQGKGPIAGEALSDAIKSTIRQGELKLGKISIPIKLASGTLELERVKIDAPDGRSTFQTMLELATMKLDSEWQIEAKLAQTSGPPERAYLPAVSVVYSGKITEYAALAPEIALSSLERELSVRKMEREVEQLEQIRKADQARAKAERDRRQALEEERAKAAAQPVPEPAPANATSTVPPGSQAPANGADTGTAAIANPAPAVAPDATAIPPTGTAATAAGTPAEMTAGADAADAAAAAPPVAPQPRPRKKPKPVEEKWQPFTPP